MVEKNMELLKKEGVGKLNEYSDIDVESLQYKSSTLDTMKEDGYYDKLLISISSMAYANKSKQFIINRLREKFPYYCKGLTLTTFNKWLRFYPEVSEAYNFNREEAYGELIYLGMEKSRRSVKVARDDFIVKFMDKLEQRELDSTNSEQSALPPQSKQTKSTINRIIEESKRFGGLDKVVVDASEEEEDEDSL